MTYSTIKPSIEELEDFFSLPVAVLGGSPSLEDDMLKLPPNCITIAVNNHAYEFGILPNFYVFFHDIETHPHLKKHYLDPQGAIVISKKDEYTDYLIDIPSYCRGYMGQFAVWLACYITTGPVIICGMDCYSGDKHYSHGQKNSENNHPLDVHLRLWKLALGDDKSDAGIKNPKRVYSVSGPLTTIFKKWK